MAIRNQPIAGKRHLGLPGYLARRVYVHKVYEICSDMSGRFRVVRALETIRGKSRFREFCKKNYWHSDNPIRLAFQLEGSPNRAVYEVIPHASTGRPSICFAEICLGGIDDWQGGADDFLEWGSGALRDS